MCNQINILKRNSDIESLLNTMSATNQPLGKGDAEGAFCLQ